ncbi:hypothetical protein G4228_008681 [Cervus hanglu yarkandensis]|nr:hypothetical protein G4228_008681 [Cervus hanglu yarkandensis]
MPLALDCSGRARPPQAISSSPSLTGHPALEHCAGIDFLVCNAVVNPLVGSTLGASEKMGDR